MIVVGIDPDSAAHGIAIYRDGILTDLEQWSLPEILKFLSRNENKKNCMFSIEDVKAKKCVYRQHSSSKARPQGEIGRRLGMCQQSQVELERMLKSLGVPFVLHKPKRGNWADTQLKGQFERITGWTKRSNADTRSAAYMGFLGLNKLIN